MGADRILSPNWRNEWAQYWSIVGKEAHNIRAFYPFDEPPAEVISNGAFGTICKALRAASTTIPILTVLDPAAVEGLEMGTFPELPPEVTLECCVHQQYVRISATFF